MWGTFDSFDTEGEKRAVPEEGKQTRGSLTVVMTKRPSLNSGSVLFILLMCDEKEVMRAASPIWLLSLCTPVFG